MSNNKVFLGNLPFLTDNQQIDDLYEELDQLLSAIGNVVDIKLIRDRYNDNKLRGFGFATFENADGAQKALELDGKEVGGRKLTVKMAQEREDRGRGGNRGGGNRGGYGQQHSRASSDDWR